MVSFMLSPAFYWLIAIVVFALIEIFTLALTTIWFAGGALGAFILALAGCGTKVQLIAFVAVSFVLLLFTRPIALKHVNAKAMKTNADSLVGKHARVTAEINNDLSAGAAVVDGQEWTARSDRDEVIIPEGTMVLIEQIKGVKLIVKEYREAV